MCVLISVLSQRCRKMLKVMGAKNIMVHIVCTEIFRQHPHFIQTLRIFASNKAKDWTRGMLDMRFLAVAMKK